MAKEKTTEWLRQSEIQIGFEGLAGNSHQSKIFLRVGTMTTVPEEVERPRQTHRRILSQSFKKPKRLAFGQAKKERKNKYQWGQISSGNPSDGSLIFSAPQRPRVGSQYGTRRRRTETKPRQTAFIVAEDVDVVVACCAASKACCSKLLPSVALWPRRPLLCLPFFAWAVACCAASISCCFMAASKRSALFPALSSAFAPAPQPVENL